MYLIHDFEKYMSSYFPCPNYKFGCLFTFADKQDLTRHLEKCKDPEKQRETATSQSVVYGPSFNMVDNLIRDGILSKRPGCLNHMVYDIESVMLPLEKVSKNTTELFEHAIVSIACTSYINGEYTTKAWAVESDTDESRAKMVKNFVQFALAEAARVEHEPELLEAVRKHEEKIEAEQCRSFQNTPKISILRRQLNEMKRYLEIPLFAYNGSRYDMVMLMKYIIQTLEDLGHLDNLFQ